MAKAKVQDTPKSDITHATLSIDALQPHPRNYRSHPEQQRERLAASLRRFGQVRSVVVQSGANGRYLIVAGHGLVEAAKSEGMTEVHADIIPATWSSDAVEGYLISDNETGRLAEDDDALLASLLQEQANAGYPLESLGSSQEALDALLAELANDELSDDVTKWPHDRGSLADRFVVPPFSILDTRQGYWIERKQTWMALGIQSEIGRGGEGLARSYGQDLMRGEHIVGMTRREADKHSNLNNAPKMPKWATGIGTENMAPGTSIFDPVLCELAYRWFSPPDGTVLDPFAGGSVRGIVASKTGRHYIGIDLRHEQVEANEEQAGSICKATDPEPQWITGDSTTIDSLLPSDTAADLLFTCPPYYDLEVYSDNPADLSAFASYDAFITMYRQIISACVERLKKDRFACIVVGDIRDKKGIYRNFVSDTIAAFQDAGAMLYNEAILVTSVGSLPIRVGRQFSASRKLGKTHQNVLVFVKGDPAKAVAACGTVEVEMPPQDDTDDDAISDEETAEYSS